MEVSQPMDVIVQGPAPGTAVLALMRHGYGRLGVLSGEAAFGARSVTDPAARRFAQALFAWLVGTNSMIMDSDLDGLRDDVEDLNHNLVADRGETNSLNDDTDGDGTPDGMEDANLNGRVDEGETDPRKADTDGDGIPDGADPEPLPRSGSPVILALNPSRGPAEGGTLVEVEGRNLPVNPRVWFGEQRATHVVRVDSTRLVAATPPIASGAKMGPAALRVANRLGNFENTMDAAFTYGAATPVRIELESIDRVREAYDGYRGSLAVTLDLADVRIDNGSFYLYTDPPLGTMDETITHGPGAIAAGRGLLLARIGTGVFLVTIGPGPEPLTGRIELGAISWRLPPPAPEQDRFRFRASDADLEVRWGGRAAVTPGEQSIDLTGAEVEAPRAPPARP
jgi:hypothetical protein